MIDKNTIELETILSPESPLIEERLPGLRIEEVSEEPDFDALRFG